MAQEIVRPKLKAADQAVASSTALVDIADLSIPVGANENIEFEFRVPFNLAGVVSGVKFQLNGPAAPTNIRYTGRLYNGAGIFAMAQGSAFGVPIAGAILSIGDFDLEIKGGLQNGPNAGTLVLQFAQNVSSISPVTVRRNAVLKVTPA